MSRDPEGRMCELIVQMEGGGTYDEDSSCPYSVKVSSQTLEDTPSGFEVLFVLLLTDVVLVLTSLEEASVSLLLRVPPFLTYVDQRVPTDGWWFLLRRPFKFS